MSLSADQHERDVCEQCGINYDYMKSEGLNLRSIPLQPK